jgi:hypothetical protein
MFNSATATLGTYMNHSNSLDVLDWKAIYEKRPQDRTIHDEQCCPVRVGRLTSHA